jgi:small subunit ribosomal protein S11
MTLIKKQIMENFGYIKIKPTFNNIFITLTDKTGNVLVSKHAGLLEFKGSKKKTPYVASQVLKDLILDLEKLNINIQAFIVQVYGFIRSGAVNSVIRQLGALHLNNIFYLEYMTIRTHNGLRKKKKRRL